MTEQTGIAPGTPVDRYVVEDVLGRGGMAVVYRVKHRQLGTLHAMKVLTLHGAGVRQRLLQEGRVQALLQHPNVVAVTDVVDVEGSPGVVMEYIRGPSLDRLLTDRRLTIEQCDTIAQGILRGVGAAHTHGLVHRDLKPGNIMLAITTEGLVPKICDFGLAKLMEGDGQTAIQTRSGVTMGTPAYMAPEQIRNAKAVDKRADIFALGAILYELVTGRRAFDGEDLLDIFTNVAAGKFVPPRELVPALPERMEAAIVGAMVVDREKRIADCSTLLAMWRGEVARATTRMATLPSVAPKGPFDLDDLRGQYASAGATAVPASEERPPSVANGATYSADQTPAPAQPRSTITSSSRADATLDANAPAPAPSRTPTAPAYGPASTLGSGDRDNQSVVAALAAMSAPPPASVRADASLALPATETIARPRRRAGINPVWFGIVGGVGGLIVLLGVVALTSSALFGVVWFGSSSSSSSASVSEPVPTSVAPAPTVPSVLAPTSQPPEAAAAITKPSSQPTTTPSLAKAPPPPKPLIPQPVAAESKPTEPAAAPAVEAPKRASVALKGDVTGAWLVGLDGVEHPLPTELPPGDYSIRVQFGDLAAESAGSVSLGAGDAKTITCNRSLRKCK